MKLFLFVIMFALTGCNIYPNGRSNSVTTVEDCCCEEYTGRRFEINRWVCSDKPYTRGECLPMWYNTCERNKRHKHRRRH